MSSRRKAFDRGMEDIDWPSTAPENSALDRARVSARRNRWREFGDVPLGRVGAKLLKGSYTD